MRLVNCRDLPRTTTHTKKERCKNSIGMYFSDFNVNINHLVKNADFDSVSWESNLSFYISNKLSLKQC